MQYFIQAPSSEDRGHSHLGRREIQRALDVGADWHDGACLPSVPPPGTSMCPCRGGKAWEGGEGRVQAERPTRTCLQGHDEAH